jgi:hypothetical protein
MEQNNDIYIIDLDQAESAEEVSIVYSSIFENMKIIRLQDHEEALIGKIDKIQVYDNYIFILDKLIAKKLFLFDKEGKYIRQIGKFGDGSGEYAEISDFTINEKTKEVIILDMKPKINIYDLETGKFVRSIQVNNEYSTSYAIQYVEGKLYVDMKNYNKDTNSCMLQAIDYQTGERTGLFINESQNNKAFHTGFHLTNSPFINKAQDQAVFYRHFMDTVFSIREEGVFPYVVLKGKNILTANDIENQGLFKSFFFGEDMMKLRAIGKMFQIINFVEYKNFLFIDYLEGYFVKRLMVEKEKKQIKKIKTFFDDFMYKEKQAECPQVGVACVTPDGIYSEISPWEFSLFTNVLGRGAYLSEFENFFLNLSEDSNPVLFYYEFK